MNPLDTHLFADFDRVSTPSRQENLVSGFDRGGNDLSLLVRRTGSDGNHGGLGQGVSRRRLGEEDAGSCFLMRNGHGQYTLLARVARDCLTVSGLNLWTKTRSRSGMTALMLLKVA